MTATAVFASRRSNLIVIEHPAIPQYEGGRQVGTTPGKTWEFRDHQCTVSGQKSIDYMRERAKAADGPEMWELDATDVPSSVELLAELAVADVDRVREILAAEQAGPDRSEITTTAKAILEKVGVAERGPGAAKAKPRHEVVTG